MSDIFLSYASADRERARLIASVLESQGWSVWWDRTIPPGATFDAVIEQALDSARCVVVLWSKTSAASDWVKTEAAEAARRKILVPAFIDAVKIPLEFRRVQAANLSDWGGGTNHPELATLFRSVADHLAAAPMGVPAERPPGDGSRKETREPPAMEAQSNQSGPRLTREASPQNRGISRWVAALAIVVLAAAGIGGGWLLWRPGVIVPDIGGLQADKAKAILKDAGFGVGQTTTKEAADAVPGTVVSQSPAPREKARKGQSVDLLVATPVLVPVPNVQGRTLAQASSALEKAGFTVGGTTSKVTDEANPGTVLAQRPDAGTRAERTATVDLIIAARETVEVPDVVGESFERARTMLTEAGLAVGRREIRQTEEATPGVVLSQNPGARTRAPQGQAISLVLAVRPPARATEPTPAARPVVEPAKPPIVLNPQHNSTIAQPYIRPWAFQWAPGRPNEKATYDVTLGRVGMTREYKTTTSELTWDPKLCGVAGPAVSGWWLKVKATLSDGSSAETQNYFSVVPPVDFAEYCRGCPDYPNCASRRAPPGGR